MARSAHAFLRGNVAQFYEWLSDGSERLIPQGPPVWICGDCHVGNLGPLSDEKGHVKIEIRDFDHSVIGNPAYDLLRLALSLATAARSSDLPGAITAHMMEQLTVGYALALRGRADGSDDKKGFVKAALRLAERRSWKRLAKERLEDSKPTIPLGRKFWPLSKIERDELITLFKTPVVRRLATALRCRDDDAEVEFLDAAYWVKGCSSLGRLRYAILLHVKGKANDEGGLCLMDIKEAVRSAVPHRGRPRESGHFAERVVAGAMRLSPYLGDRMLPVRVQGKSAFLRELLPQDLMLEVARLGKAEARAAARRLGYIVGCAHARQMDSGEKKAWSRAVTKGSKMTGVPPWLWSNALTLLSRYETAYLEHCRRTALA